MARPWTEQCKIEAVKAIEHKMEEIGGKVTPAIRKISKESDIPYGTLKDWYYREHSDDPESQDPGNRAKSSGTVWNSIIRRMKNLTTSIEKADRAAMSDKEWGDFEAEVKRLTTTMNSVKKDHQNAA